MRGMSLLRFLYVALLALWLGGAVALGGLAAPATFEVLQQEYPDTGRSLAGRVFGETLRRFHLASYAAGALMVMCLAGIATMAPSPVGVGAKVGVVLAMLIASAYSGVVVSPRIERMQQAIGQPVASLPAGDPRRGQFGRLHALSTALLAAGAAGTLLLLYWEARR